MALAMFVDCIGLTDCPCLPCVRERDDRDEALDLYEQDTYLESYWDREPESAPEPFEEDEDGPPDTP